MSTDELVAERKRKIAELAELGVPAANVDFSPDHSMEKARWALTAWEADRPEAERDAAEELGPEVAVAGRLMQYRLQGKSCFCHVEDESGRMQAWFKVDALDEQTWRVVKLLDLGDLIGVHGRLMRTRRGEPTVLADSLTLLVKSLRQPPEKFHGLQDQETRYRKRYYDLMASTEQRRHFRARSTIVRSVRHTLEQRGFLEVETPILQLIPGGGHAVPFMTHWNALDTDVHLRIAIELHLKRLLVGGFNRVFEIGRVFRNEGLSPRHNPEFSMLEAYQAYGDYTAMRELTEAIVVEAAHAVGPQTIVDEEGGSHPCEDPLRRFYDGREISFVPPFRAERMADLIQTTTGLDALAAWDQGTIDSDAKALGVELKPGMSAGQVFFEIYEQRVERELFDPTFVLDYPADVSPLARRRSDDPRFVERFELVVAGRELANAFSELNDPVDQRERFEAQARQRDKGDAEAQRLDEDFLEAIEAGMPPAGGLGVGIDRLVMLLTDKQAIRDVLLFPTMRPRHEDEA
jgi:lysyl-tRNA synthetase class 2